MEKRISSTDAARLIGIRTQTLAKWRWQGKGPAGWVRISPTHVTYPLSAIDATNASRLPDSAVLWQDQARGDFEHPRGQVHRTHEKERPLTELHKQRGAPHQDAAPAGRRARCHCRLSPQKESAERKREAA